MTPLEQLLQRSRMFDLFVRVICDTPHASGNERGLIDVLAQWAETCGFEARTDKIGNLGILVPGRGKYTGTKKALLCQCHADMVPNKLATSSHDFDKDPIQVRLVDGWLYGTDTTLGSDNGLGGAAMLAAAEDPKLESAPFVILFTVREETDMAGTQNLDPFLTFQDQVELVGGVNLDSEEGETDVFFGCAGGTKIESTFKNTEADLQTPASDDFVGFCLNVSGFSGGHSGSEIDKCHQNAILVAARFLCLSNGDFVFADGKGGNKQNSIPTDCQLRGFMSPDEFERMTQLLPDFIDTLQGEIVPADEKFVITFEPCDLPMELNSLWSVEDSEGLVLFLSLTPNGQLATDQLVAYKLPRTSSNLGVLKLTSEECKLTFLVRSSVNTERELTASKITVLGDLLGFESVAEEVFPCWQPDPNNQVLLAAEKLWKDAFGCTLQRKVTHGGLECGELRKKLGGLQMISFGGHIVRAHEPDEHANVDSWFRVQAGFKYLLCHLVKELGA